MSNSSDPASERALAEVVRRLKRMRKADGYNTDAGLRVYRARRSIPLELCPAIAVWGLSESYAPSQGTGAALVTLQVSVVGFAPLDRALSLGECLKADIKRAVLTGSRAALADDSGKLGTIAITSCSLVGPDSAGTVESVSVEFDLVFIDLDLDGSGCVPCNQTGVLATRIAQAL